MKRMRFFRFIVAAGLLFSAAVCAQEAYTTRQANVRAGPDRDYPLVATLAAGTPVTVMGCVSDYSWCDIVFGEIRGWMYAKSLQYVYENRWVPLYGYGAAIGLPIITFSILSYWDDFYRNRPFYRDRPRWEHRPYPGGPGFVPPPRPREPQYRPPRPDQPQLRPQRPDQPQVRPPRPVEPQYRPPRPAEPQVRPQRQVEPLQRPPQVERSQVQPSQSPPGSPRGDRPIRGG